MSNPENAFEAAENDLNPMPRGPQESKDRDFFKEAEEDLNPVGKVTTIDPMEEADAVNGKPSTDPFDDAEEELAGTRR